MTKTNLSRELATYLSHETRALFDEIFDGVFVVDEAGNIVFWNRGAVRVTGFGADTMIGRHCWEVFSPGRLPKDKNRCRPDCPLKVVPGQGTMEFKKTFTAHDASELSLLMKGSPLRSLEGKVIGAIEVFKDVTEEERLRVLNSRYDEAMRRRLPEEEYQRMKEIIGSGHSLPDDAVLKDSTVLYAEMTMFESLTLGLSPSLIMRMTEIFSRFVTVTSEKRNGYCGTSTGDSMIAVFASADDAVQAAGELAAGTDAFWRILEENELPRVNIKIGIESGSIIEAAKAGGEDPSQESKSAGYRPGIPETMALGGIVDGAIRTAELSLPCSYCISESCLVRLKDPVKFVFRGQVALKGGHRLISVFCENLPRD